MKEGPKGFWTMGITVRQALQLNELREVELLAGKKGLERVINSVSVLEVPQPLPWIKGHELFLTTFYSYPQEAEELVSLARAFHGQGVAALAVHPGGGSLKCPGEFLDAADEMGFPVLRLPQEMPYMVVITAVLGSILNRQALILQRSHEINTQLTRLVLCGADIQKIAEAIVGLIGRPVLILEPDGSVLAAAAANPKDECFVKGVTRTRQYAAALARLRGMRASGELFRHQGPLRFELPGGGAGGSVMVCLPVLVGRECYGYLLTWEKEQAPLEEIDFLALNHGTTTAALEIIKQNAIAEVRRNLNDDFIEELLAGACGSLEVLCRRAEALGLPVQGKNAVVVAEADGPEHYLLHRDRPKAKVQALVRGAFSGYDPEALICVQSRSVVVVTRVDGRFSARQQKQKLEPVIRELLVRLGEKVPGLTLSAGVGWCAENPLELSAAYKKAKEALQTGRTISGGGSVTWYDDLGVYRLLGGLCSTDRDLLRSYCDQYLLPLIRHDAEKGAGLVKTLEAFLDAGESTRLAAQRLFVHPNTVKYRLEKAKALLGYDPFEDEEGRLNLYLALKAYKLLI